MTDEVIMNEIKPVKNWREVLRNAWSVRLMGLNAILSPMSIALPIIEPLVPLKYLIGFAVLVFAVNIAALGARFVAQKNVGSET